MQFHDFRPWRASKIMRRSCRFLTDDFMFKSSVGIKISPFQTLPKHQHLALTNGFGYVLKLSLKHSVFTTIFWRIILTLDFIDPLSKLSHLTTRPQECIKRYEFQGASEVRRQRRLLTSGGSDNTVVFVGLSLWPLWEGQNQWSLCVRKIIKLQHH